MENTPMRVVMDPVTVLEKDATAAALGNAVFDSLERSKNARPVSRKEIGKHKFWQVMGIKGFASFSRKFQCVDIEETETVLQLSKLVRDTDGSYSWPAGLVPVEVPAGTAAERLGAAVLSLLSEPPEPCGSGTMTFETVHDRTVTYRRPSDEFTDCGDGHTDAYQVFSYEDAPQSYLAFLIDSGYSRLSGPAIQEKWREQYGTLLEFRFQAAHKPPLLCRVYGRTDRQILTSCLFKDGGGSVEVLASIALELPKDTREKIAREFEAVIRSISL